MKSGAISPYFDEAQASQYIHMSKSWLRQARMKGTGPKFAKVGKAVRYLINDLDLFMQDRGYTSTFQHKMLSKEQTPKEGGL